MHSDYLGRKMERLILEQEVQSMDHYFKLISFTYITCTYIHSPTTPANQKLTSLILHENTIYMYKDIYRMSTIIITYVYITHTYMYMYTIFLSAGQGLPISNLISSARGLICTNMECHVIIIQYLKLLHVSYMYHTCMYMYMCEFAYNHNICINMHMYERV